MGKGQRAKKEQASLATAALLTQPTKKTPSLLAMENQRILSPSAPSYMPSSTHTQQSSPGTIAAPAVGVSTPGKEEQLVSQQKMAGYFSNTSSIRVQIVKNYFMTIAEEFSQLRIDDSIPAQFHQIVFTPLELAQIVERCGLCSPEGSLIICSVINSIQGDYSNPNLGALGRGIDLEISLKIISYLQSPDSLDREMESIVALVLPALLKYHNHKNNRIRDLTGQICKSFSSNLLPQIQGVIFPILITYLQPDEDWKIRVAALDILHQLSRVAKQLLSPLLPTLIPAVSECMKDSKKQLSTVATDTMLFACSFINNDDISHLVPQLVSVISHPEESPATLDKLLETTFVATVDGPTLALITPLLAKSLKERSSVTKRKASKVIENMCKLVQNPADVQPFVPLLLPSLDKTIDEVVDPEVCEVARSAREVLVRAMGESVVDVDPITTFSANLTQEMFVLIGNNILKYKQDHSIPPSILSPSEVVVRNILTHYMASQLSALILYSSKAFTPLQIATNQGIPSSLEISTPVWNLAVASTSVKVWNECTEPHVASMLSHFHSQQQQQKQQLAPVANVEDDNDNSADLASNAAVSDSDIVILNPRHEFSVNLRILALKGNPDYHDEGGNDMEDCLCDFEFSLAFGGKILLHNTNLRLVRGRRYGIMGKNGVGKTTLMTNIGSGNIEGLPSSLRTVYVQHDDHSYVSPELSILDELMSYPLLVAGVEEAVETLTEVGFTEEMMSSSRLTLSGGWKMKLLIVRAILSKADILLLDEPTNHLDTNSVQWLVNYLRSQTQLTCLIVSHDPQFLDQVITDVIHYEQKQLVYYPGSLKDFVVLHPEAQYYYQLETSTMKFVFPNPERLDGVNSLTRAIMKMDNVTFTYPGCSKPSLTDCSVKLTLGSRVGVTGVNGAGKSTLIKLLVQELSPNQNADGTPMGEVWKHHNLRTAYVAQHSFYHIEQHLDQSPVDYIKWRFANGVDKEDFTRSHLKLSEDEEEIVTEKKLGDIDEVLGRRKNGRTMEYECTFIGQTPKDENKYIPLEAMIDLGLSKLVAQCDNRIAAMVAGLDIRPLITREIQTHLDDFNLDAEFGTHGKIRQLSGGQKVKLVLAAAMWNKPHILFLDEPTNYLDREALAALTEAIKSFTGGVVIISHNSEFVQTLCTEYWEVKDGICHVIGDGSDEDNEGKEMKLKKGSSRKLRSKIAGENESESGTWSGPSTAGSVDSVGNLNSTKTVMKEILKNPKTLEPLTKVEIRKLTKCALAAGVSLKEYVSKINKNSPEWKWLSSSIK